jgi:hypothetical protein
VTFLYLTKKKYSILGARASRPQDLADTDSFPKQESIRRFRGIVVDSAVLEHNGGRGHPRSQCASIFEAAVHARGVLMAHEYLSINAGYVHEHVHPAVHGCFC